MWHRTARFGAQRLLLRPVVRTVTRVVVEGKDNLDGLTAPFVMVANHASHLDAALVVTQLPWRLTRDLAAGAAVDYFYRQWWKKIPASLFFNTYPVGRTREDLAKGKGIAVRLLSEDIPLLIFPEGTRRQLAPDAKRFKLGAAALCVGQDVPCVPVAIVGTAAAMPVGRFWPVPGRPVVKMLVGRPMRPAPGEKIRDFNDRVAARIATMLDTGTPYILDGQRADDERHRGENTQEEAS